MSLADILNQTRVPVREITERYNELWDESYNLTNAVDDAEAELERAREAVDEASDGSIVPAELTEQLDAAQVKYDEAKAKLAAWVGEYGEEFNEAGRAEARVSGLGGNAELITESELEKHAISQAEDLGVDLSAWPATCIDWKQAAHELSADITSIDVAGESFYLIGE